MRLSKNQNVDGIIGIWQFTNIDPAKRIKKNRLKETSVVEVGQQKGSSTSIDIIHSESHDIPLKRRRQNLERDLFLVYVKKKVLFTTTSIICQYKY